MSKNKKNILVSVAWPYANGGIHMGHMAGCYLPADIFARFHRMLGNNVLMVSGSDAHGTPVVIKSIQENKTLEELFDFYHKDILKTWDNYLILFVCLLQFLDFNLICLQCFLVFLYLLKTIFFYFFFQLFL